MQHYNNLRVSFVLSVYLMTITRAMQFPGPSITQNHARVGLEVVLAPTPGPTCRPHARGLRNRQDSVSLATCGFIGGDADLPVTCGTDLYCATTSTYVGCCEAANCVGIFTTCYDLLGDSCDATCQNNPDNLVCPTSLPYCAEYQYEGGSIGYGCALDRGYTTTVLLTTKDTLGTVTTPSTTSTSTNGTTTSAMVSPTAEPVDSSSGLGAGAIAGIAVGSAAGVAIVVALIWMIRRKKQKKALHAAPDTDVPQTKPHPNMQMHEPISSVRYSDATTAYALPSPRTDPWKHSWQSYSEQGSPHGATNGYSGSRTPTGVPEAPAEMPTPDPRSIPSELDGSQR